MTTYLYLKLKSQTRKLWETWCSFVMEHHQQEALTTLREEQLLREANFIFGDDNDSYVVYVHETEPGEEKLPWNKEHSLNWLHYHIFHTCLEKISEHTEEEGAALLTSLTQQYGEPKIGYDLQVE